MKTARIHSIETMGLVDGPGIRYVVFLQGCPLRCIYCHNPDTWDGGCKKARQMSVDEMVEDILKYKSYFNSSGGGVTIGGGEPLVQKSFVLELFKILKGHNIHTALDTSGFTKMDTVTKELLALTDLVILDIKGTKTSYREITGQPIDATFEFAKYLSDQKIPMWVRFVLVPGVNDNDDEYRGLAELLKNFSNMEKFEILPFHQLGKHKWSALNAPYKLEKTKAATKSQAQAAEARVSSFLGFDMKTR